MCIPSAFITFLLLSVIQTQRERRFPSKPTINHIQPLIPRDIHPLHILHPPSPIHDSPLLLADGHEELSRPVSILTDSFPLERTDEVDSVEFQIRGRGRNARHEDGEDGFPPLKVSEFDLVRGEGEDEADATVRVVEDFLLGCGGDAALMGEHAGADVDGGGVVEEESLGARMNGQILYFIIGMFRDSRSRRHSVPCWTILHLLVTRDPRDPGTLVAKRYAFHPEAA